MAVAVGLNIVKISEIAIRSGVPSADFGVFNAIYCVFVVHQVEQRLNLIKQHLHQIQNCLYHIQQRLQQIHQI